VRPEGLCGLAIVFCEEILEEEISLEAIICRKMKRMKISLKLETIINSESLGSEGRCIRRAASVEKQKYVSPHQNTH
jgi:hypothetical protein